MTKKILRLRYTVGQVLYLIYVVAKILCHNYMVG